MLWVKDRAMNTGKTPPLRRKLIAFDRETWQALDLLARDTMKSWQELSDEAFRDLLKKHGRADDLKSALRLSIKQAGSKTQPRRPKGSSGEA
jgi:hypothetical protein